MMRSPAAGAPARLPRPRPRRTAGSRPASPARTRQCRVQLPAHSGRRPRPVQEGLPLRCARPARDVNRRGQGKHPACALVSLALGSADHRTACLESALGIEPVCSGGDQPPISFKFEPRLSLGVEKTVEVTGPLTTTIGARYSITDKAIEPIWRLSAKINDHVSLSLDTRQAGCKLSRDINRNDTRLFTAILKLGYKHSLAGEELVPAFAKERFKYGIDGSNPHKYLVAAGGVYIAGSGKYVETSPSIRLPGKLSKVQLTTGVGFQTGASQKSGARIMQVSIASLDATVKL
eukprot:scaffold2560_cov397-Prasinococcus_capsulatus_cf.AAC.10